MSEDSRDGVTLIGLQRLSSSRIAGAVPEVPVLKVLGSNPSIPGNVLPFPEAMVRDPDIAPVSPLGPDGANGRNVVAFAPPAGKTSGRSRKA